MHLDPRLAQPGGDAMSGQRKGRKRMRSGLFLPLFDPLADPGVVARLAAEAEEAGWDGIFVWDHVRWRGAGPSRSRARRPRSICSAAGG